MRRGLKFINIIIAAIILSGCAAIRKDRTPEPDTGPETADFITVTSMVTGNNITDGGFEIRRGSIELEGTEIEGRFGLHARLNSIGDFYASVRGPLGIELARILIVGNDVAAIDRFNRKVYIGKKDDVMKKNGLPEDFMKILFGDLPAEGGENYRTSGRDEILISAGDKSFTRELTICRSQLKICREKIDAEETGHSVLLNFEEFREAGGKRYASRISMEERKRMFHVKLYIDDMIYGYDSPIELNIPSYQREKL